MLFNPDHRKQRMEVYFLNVKNQDSLLLLEFNDNTIQTVKVYIYLAFH